MKLLWTLNAQYDKFDTSNFNHVIDCGDTVYIPFSGNEGDNEIHITFVQVDKQSGKLIDNSPQRQESFALFPNIYYTKKIYVFGDKTVKYKSEHYIECLQNGKPIWQFKHWAYLYTDIIEKDGCVIFGTDGMGGRLYCLDLNTGKLISETKTHFSGFYDYNGFNWIGDNLVVYGKGTLAVLNPITGEIIDEHKIPSKYPYRSYLQVIDGYAYCCVHTDSNDASVLCFEL